MGWGEPRDLPPAEPWRSSTTHEPLVPAAHGVETSRIVGILSALEVRFEMPESRGVWLYSRQPELGDRRPVDLLALGELDAVEEAVCV